VEVRRRGRQRGEREASTIWQGPFPREVAEHQQAMPLSVEQKALCEHLKSFADPVGTAAAELTHQLAGQIDDLWDKLNKVYRQDLAQQEIQHLREQLGRVQQPAECVICSTPTKGSLGLVRSACDAMEPQKREPRADDRRPGQGVLHAKAAGQSIKRTDELKWWQQTAVYEIAVISFQDSNGDGKGDLRGVIERIDYLEWLGVGAVWLTPIFSSPMLDLGYDIADFCAVDPIFGSLRDFDELVELLHTRGMRLILDLVPNHTSDKHPWFTQSRSSRSNPKRDWYIWADMAADGGPPNNWLSRFGGSAWQWDETTKQYYYHSFLMEQPDLNWRNPAVRLAMAETIRFWLQRGVDGFRVDASAVLAEDDLLRDDPVDPEADERTPPPQRLKRIFTDDRPESMSYIEEIRRVVDEYEDRVLCGEVQGSTERIGHFYGQESARFHLPLNFVLLDSQWNALSLQANIDGYVNAIPESAWPDWVVGGHDKPRIASKIGQPQARVLAMLLMTLKGTPFLFAGDELGLEQVTIAPERIRDPFEKLVPGFGLNRDPERAPMRWDDSRAAGFTTGEPWLPMGENVRDRNVEKLQADDRSLLWLYKRLIGLRQSEVALVKGEYIPVRSRNDLLIYKRIWNSETVLVALNVVDQPRKLEWSGEGVLVLSTYLDGEGTLKRGPLILRPNEGIILKLST
jgi:alpha-glucosidase